METKAAESAGDLAALDGLVADLGPLAGLLPERSAPEQDFNLFKLLNQWWQEDVHSRCLTWLLDPQGSHGAGVYFLENFLLHTAERSASLGTPTIRIASPKWLPNESGCLKYDATENAEAACGLSAPETRFSRWLQRYPRSRRWKWDKVGGGGKPRTSGSRNECWANQIWYPLIEAVHN